MSTIREIDKLLGEQKSSPIVKGYFKERDSRFPIIGKFVALKDHKELSCKGFARFVSTSRLDFWSDENPQIGLTRIFAVGDFAQIKKVEV